MNTFSNCIDGYYDSLTECLACLFSCITCDTGDTCLTCKNSSNPARIGAACICPE